jgi:putative mRNA 3-end processing factor
MSPSLSWIRPEPWGIHIVPADAWVDPSRPVPRALVTHGHADHARGGHGVTIATPATLAIMELRYQTREGASATEYGETLDIGGGVTATFVPAGHVLGSAQILLEHAGERVIITGDYKRAPDPTATPFAVTPCDIFITEATFGLPVFTHPPIAGEISKLLISLRDNPESCVLVGAYALGKAQRVIVLLRAAGWDRTIYVHGALERLNALYEACGVSLGPLAPATHLAGRTLAGEIVLAPPSATQDRWSRRFAEPVAAFASGWMGVRARARQRGAELPLVISDHADWDELTRTLEEVNAGEVWITHGREEGLLRWCELNGRTGRALRLVGYDEEDAEPAAA